MSASVCHPQQPIRRRLDPLGRRRLGRLNTAEALSLLCLREVMVVVLKPDIGAVQPKCQHSAILRGRFNGVWRAWVPAAIRPVPPDPLSKAFESARTDSLRIRPKLYLVEVGCRVDGRPAGSGSRSTPRNAANQVAAHQGTDLL